MSFAVKLRDLSIEKIIAEVYSEPSKTSKMKHFAKIANSFQPVNYFRRKLVLMFDPFDVLYALRHLREEESGSLFFWTVKLLIPAQVCSGCDNPT